MMDTKTYNEITPNMETINKYPNIKQARKLK